ncbi:MAG TPA: uracil-DNA glycosylase, partial [Verrucomicrobiae bacterium]|nr:uracil-DNA glycosylase [Verrucomicrobiae bacterium]
MKKFKLKQLNRIAKEIQACRLCKRNKIGLPVPGEGNPDARIVFIGEAPGKTEARTGRPFVGRSGRLLRQMINSIGLSDTKDVYITSPVKYLPSHGTPTPQEITHGKIHLNNQLNVINPKVIVLLGNVAVQAVLGMKLPILKDHGKIIEIAGRKHLITLHPAAVLRFPKYNKL